MLCVSAEQLCSGAVQRIASNVILSIAELCYYLSTECVVMLEQLEPGPVRQHVTSQIRVQVVVTTTSLESEIIQSQVNHIRPAHVQSLETL